MREAKIEPVIAPMADERNQCCVICGESDDLADMKRPTVRIVIQGLRQ